ncbi:IclR family transcriptional regulator [Halobacteriales archaeon QS_1_68_17]|nr:MAG: IclR family transcriptional regulator [Halobacteriales archaeon QS_1_68_17]
MPKTGEKKRIKASKRTLQILDTLMEVGGATGTELAEATGLPKSTVHYHLKTLEDFEYVVNASGEYKPALKFLTIGNGRRAGMDLYRVAKPQVDRLAKETGEMCVLMCEEYGYGFYLYSNSGERGVDFEATGSRKTLHDNALGKAILAYLPQERVDSIIETRGLLENTRHTVTDRQRLMKQLDRIREQGVAFDREEQLEGLCCVAAPITRYVDKERQDVLGSISLAGPASRMEGEYFEDELARLVSDAANMIELEIQDY